MKPWINKKIIFECRKKEKLYKNFKKKNTEASKEKYYSQKYKVIKMVKDAKNTYFKKYSSMIFKIINYGNIYTHLNLIISVILLKILKIMIKY